MGCFLTIRSSRSLRCFGFRAASPFSLAFLSASLAIAPAGSARSADDGLSTKVQNGPVQGSVRKSQSDWRVSLGGGARMGPKYEGSDEMKISAMPFFGLSWRDYVFLDGMQGLGVNAIRTRRFRLGLAVGYAPGRDQDDSDRLQGLGDIDPAARVRLFGAYSLGPVRLSANISRDFGGSDGFQIRPQVMVPFPLSKKVRLMSGVSVTWADSNYMESYFGVTPGQSVLSGLPTFDADAGFKSVAFQFGVNWDLTERWFARASVGVGHLLGDAADSPITESHVQPSVGLFVGYKF